MSPFGEGVTWLPRADVIETQASWFIVFLLLLGVNGPAQGATRNGGWNGGEAVGAWGVMGDDQVGVGVEG